MEILIEVWEENGTGKILRLEGEHFTLGRNNCSIPLEDLNCSRIHAEINVLENGDVYLRDLGSTNGTFLNGSRLLEDSQINTGDSIQLGDIVIHVARINGEQSNVQSFKTEDSLTGWPEFLVPAFK